jgi:diguanylate cyclase (GGDEF)-like protein
LKRLWSFRSLGTRLQALVGLAFVAGLAIFVCFQSYARLNLTLAERRDANTRIVTGLAGPMSEAVKGGHNSIMFGYMEVLATDPSAAAIVIAEQQKILLSQQSVDYRALPLKKLKALVLQAEISGKVETVDVGDYQFVASPIKDSGGRVVGSFAAAWSTKGILAGVLRDTLIEAVSLISIVFAVLLLLVRSMNKFVIRPLAALAGQIDGSGTKSDVATYEDRLDEIGSFARALGKFKLLHDHFDAALANMSQGLCMYDKNQRLVIFNERYLETYAIPTGKLKQGMTMLEVLHVNVQHNSIDDDVTESYFADRVLQAGSRKPTKTTYRLGNKRTIVVAHQPTDDGGWVETHSDITDLQRIQEQIEFQAQHDSLTKLANRLQLRERLDHFLESQKTDKAAALLYIDLDGFKTVNDTLGHAAGDSLLKVVADRLRDLAKGTDIVARLGGDEFVIVRFGMSGPKEIEHFGAMICADLAKPFLLEDRHVLIGASIGTAIGPEDGETADILLKSADLALFEAKNGGKNTCRSFNKELSTRQLQKREMEVDLRVALSEQQFELYYQPIVDLKLDRVAGFEALIRWRHPTRGMISPLEFIPAAEEMGLIVPIGEWVLRSACTEASKWPAHTRVAVNISPSQFHGCDLPQLVFSALAGARLAPGRLELEVTESALLQEGTSTLDALNNLRGFGVRIAIDDFGTGYSALGYLRKFPFDKIKIDRSFVSDLTNENPESVIVNAIVGMSRSLKMSTVAEGVETAKQRDLVMAAGVTEMQGYFFSRPVPANEVLPKFFPNYGVQDQALLKASRRGMR